MAKVRLMDMPCSIARSLDVVGEWWSLLVLRDVFRGLRRFELIQRDLGVASNVLTARLSRLRADGLLERRPYQERPVRYEYFLTDKGRDLYPVMIALIQWGDKHLAGADGPPRALIHLTCGEESTAKLVCTHCEGEMTARNTKYVERDDVRDAIATAG